MGVKVEIWTGEVLRGFKRDGGFLNTIPDRSSLVKNSAIHLVDLGADPNILVNNTTYPIATTQASDGDIIIGLDKLDTENTGIREDYLFALSFDAIAEYTESHILSLLESMADRAIHAIAPAGNTTATPIISTTGATDGETQARKQITKADILKLKKKFDDNNIPKVGRVLVLCPEHVQQILAFDELFANQYQNIREGQILRLYGFDIYEYGKMPLYDASNAKKAWGAAAAPTTDRYASVAYYAPRMFKAMGMPKMFYREATTDPENRMTTIGFQHRFICMPKKSESIGAIVSVPTA
jgi:hypothetical protein